MRAIEGDIGGLIVAQAATGDELAFARIVAAHHDDMARVAFVVCHDVQMAHEAAHAAWPLAWWNFQDQSIEPPRRNSGCVFARRRASCLSPRCLPSSSPARRGHSHRCRMRSRGRHRPG